MNIKTVLKKFNLKSIEIDVYLAVLKLGSASATQIAKIANIKRTYIYDIAKALEQKGLLTITFHKKKKQFVAQPPEKIKELQQENLKLLDQILPEIKLMQRTIDIKPVISYYEGTEGIKSIYSDTIKEGKEILAFVAVPEGLQSKLGNYLINYVKQRSEKKIMAKAIAPDSPIAREFQKRDQQELRQTKLISENDYPFSIEINIYGYKVAFISYKENELVGVIIESMEIAKTMKSIHNFFWDKLD